MIAGSRGVDERSEGSVVVDRAERDGAEVEGSSCGGSGKTGAEGRTAASSVDGEDDFGGLKEEGGGLDSWTD